MTMGFPLERGQYMENNMENSFLTLTLLCNDQLVYNI